MGRHVGQPMITTSVRISPEFHKLCIEHRISFSEAMKIGISLVLAENGIKEYDNNLNLFRRMTLIQKKLEETSQELFNLKEKHNIQDHNKKEVKI